MTSPGAGAGAGASQKPICIICYEDLRPIVEDLQSIPLCGHVFHELCIQQWLEYCPAGKSPTCPVCKRSCSRSSLTRLFFQSTGDTTACAGPAIASSQSPSSETLVDEVRRLEGKLSSLSSAFQGQQSRLKELDDEVSQWKELVRAETAKNKEIRTEKSCLERLLRQKEEERLRVSSECLKLEARNLALAKELAAIKLATDLNLAEEEMLKLASIGHGASHSNAVDILKRSLALRNKSYKELMAQCNHLGRAETLTLQKLEKAQEKIKKLKTRLQELEKAAEENENGTLRGLKASSLSKSKRVDMHCVKENVSTCGNYSLQDPTVNFPGIMTNSNQKVKLSDHSSHSNRFVEDTSCQKDSTLLPCKEGKDFLDIEDNRFVLEDVDVIALSANRRSRFAHISNDQIQPKISFTKESLTSGSGRQLFDQDTVKIIEERSVKHECSRSTGAEKISFGSIHNQLLPVKKDVEAHESFDRPGDPLFSGHFTHEVAGKNTGKWCRLAEKKASPSIMMQDSANSGNLIAVGADGRGGRIKVLRAHDSFLETKNQQLCPKRCKRDEAKPSVQSQIEHFFGRIVQRSL